MKVELDLVNMVIQQGKDIAALKTLVETVMFPTMTVVLLTFITNIIQFRFFRNYKNGNGSGPAGKSS